MTVTVDQLPTANFVDSGLRVIPGDYLAPTNPGNEGTLATVHIDGRRAVAVHTRDPEFNLPALRVLNWVEPPKDQP